MSETYPQRTHEEPSVNVRAVLVAGLLLAVFIAVAMVALRLWSAVMGRGKEQSPPARAADVEMQQVPLDPRQRDHRVDYENQQRELLSSYGWVDRDRGVVRIPIDAAMRQLVEQRKEESK